MSDDDWGKVEEEALKTLIRDTIKAAGPMDPSQIPHRVKERIKGRATGGLDIDAYIKEALKDAQKK